eukprot:TRINITY_DN22860_c0_g1_i1.p1 TRINITY_DN22860_c0_g1~~TRINITY_DN22860_c0_g1_i1.p1  ORF type:complete len:145 (-),score=23.26 TRINITY_DN22860_c0_g1_i1:141-542(-)
MRDNMSIFYLEGDDLLLSSDSSDFSSDSDDEGIDPSWIVDEQTSKVSRVRLSEFTRLKDQQRRLLLLQEKKPKQDKKGAKGARFRKLKEKPKTMKTTRKELLALQTKLKKSNPRPKSISGSFRDKPKVKKISN